MKLILEAIKSLFRKLENRISNFGWGDLKDKPFWAETKYAPSVLFESETWSDGDGSLCCEVRLPRKIDAGERINFTFSGSPDRKSITLAGIVKGENYEYILDFGDEVDQKMRLSADIRYGKFGGSDVAYWMFTLFFDISYKYRKVTATLPEVLVKEEIVHKIDSKYLPTPDWNQNDPEEAGYIANRPFYERYGLTRLQKATTIVLGENGRGSYDSSWYPEYDKTYIVIWDGVEYTSEPTYEDSDMIIHLCVKIDGETVDFYDGNHVFGTPSMAGEHTFEICEPGMEVVEIPERFIPKDATKMNTVDPNGSGSFSMNRKPDSVVGYRSYAEGNNTSALGSYSHAEGNNTIARGDSAHVSGAYNIDYLYFKKRTILSVQETIGKMSNIYWAKEYTFDNKTGVYTLVEGHVYEWFYDVRDNNTIRYAIVGGVSSTTMYERTGGIYMTASGSNVGFYAGGTEYTRTSAMGTRIGYSTIVGNGTSDTDRSNAYTLDWSGIPWTQGRPQFGGNAQDEGSQTVMANGDKELILTSSTADSTKKFKITVDDSGILTVTDVAT